MEVDGKEEEADSEVDGEGLLAVVSFSLPFFFGMIAGSLAERLIVGSVTSMLYSPRSSTIAGVFEV